MAYIVMACDPQATPFEPMCKPAIQRAAFGRLLGPGRSKVRGIFLWPHLWLVDLRRDAKLGLEAKHAREEGVGSISASPTACQLRGYGRAGTQNDHLGGTQNDCLSEAVILSTSTPIPAQ